MALRTKPSPWHVSEEFIEALAMGRPTSSPDLTVGLKHITACPGCLKRLEEERRTIDLLRMALAAESNSEETVVPRLLLIRRDVTEDIRTLPADQPGLTSDDENAHR